MLLLSLKDSHAFKHGMSLILLHILSSNVDDQCNYVPNFDTLTKMDILYKDKCT